MDRRPRLWVVSLWGLGLAAELATAGMLLWRWHQWPAFALYMLLHGLACLVIALTMPSMLPARIKAVALNGRLFFWLMCCFIPVFGALGLAFTALPALRRARMERKAAAWSATDIPDLPAEPFRVTSQPIYVAVGLVGVLRHAQQTVQRLQAVMATRQLPDREAVPILNVALKDPADDVRLLAYSLLDGKERLIYSQIKSDAQLVDQGTAAEKALVHRRLARSYWELAYLGLAQGDVLHHVLGEAQTHVEAALKDLPTDAGLHLLRARILLKKNDADGARAAFEEAQQAGLPQQVVSPHLAEVAFLQRRFADVATQLEFLDPQARSRYPLALVANYWLEPPPNPEDEHGVSEIEQ